jgi:hypothetical protein
MARFMRLILGFAVLCFLTAAAGAQEWREFKPQDGAYRVSMPGPVESRADDVRAETLSLKGFTGTVRRTVVSANADAFYSVVVLEFPEGFPGSADLEASFVQVRDDQARLLRGTWTDERQMSVGGYPARRYTVVEGGDASAAGTAHTAAVLHVIAANRMIIARVMRTKRPATHPDTERFFASLAIAPH